MTIQRIVNKRQTGKLPIYLQNDHLLPIQQHIAIALRLGIP